VKVRQDLALTETTIEAHHIEHALAPGLESAPLAARSDYGWSLGGAHCGPGNAARGFRASA
jgi:hypothetical protein